MSIKEMLEMDKRITVAAVVVDICR
jgi:hypothetical protein